MLDALCVYYSYLYGLRVYFGILGRSYYATFGTKISVFRGNAEHLFGYKMGKNDGFTKMSVES